MHIPDGYLGPQTYIPAYGVMAALWAVGLAKLKKSLRLRQIPLLALGAAFSFVIMMFNVPIPGGTTGHAVGAVLVAVLLGPWAAMVAVSLAVIVQALIFGDGGITAIGANCFTMGVVTPFVGWWLYRLIAGSAPAQSARQWVGGAVGGWAGLTASGTVAGILFGIQPLIAHDASGRALYSPFGLGVAVPVMLFEHMLIFGLVEAVATGLVIVMLQKTSPELLPNSTPKLEKPAVNWWKRGAIILGVLVVLAPLGLWLPELTKAGTAWGEWSGAEIKTLLAQQSGGKTEGYVPEGIKNAEDKGYKAPLPDYNLPGKDTAPLPQKSMIYILSGAIGVMILGMMIILFKKLFARKENDESTHRDANV